MRSSINGSSSAADIEKEESIVSQALGRLAVVFENYPDLKSNTNYQNLMISEDKVRKARLIYNDSVTKLNRTIRMFLISIVAQFLELIKEIIYKQMQLNKKCQA